MDIISQYHARRETPYPGLPMECVITVRKYPDGFVPVSDALGMGKTYRDEHMAAYDLARRHGYTIVGKVGPDFCEKSPIHIHVRAPLDPQCIHCGTRMRMYEVREIALGETQRMVTCASASDAILLAKQWRDEWGSRTVALDPDGNVIAEHAAGMPR